MVMKLYATKKELFCTKKKEKSRESEPNWFKKRLTRKYILCSFPTTIADCLHRTLFANRVRTRNKQTNNNNRLMSINFRSRRRKSSLRPKVGAGKEGEEDNKLIWMWMLMYWFFQWAARLLLVAPGSQNEEGIMQSVADTSRNFQRLAENINKKEMKATAGSWPRSVTLPSARDYYWENLKK